MAETKAVNLTKEEIENLINYHGYTQGNAFDTRLERMNYLYKRLKAFEEPEEKTPLQKAIADTPNQNQSAALGNATNLNQGWGNSNG